MTILGNGCFVKGGGWITQETEQIAFCTNNLVYTRIFCFISPPQYPVQILYLF